MLFIWTFYSSEFLKKKKKNVSLFPEKYWADKVNSKKSFWITNM